MKHFLWCSVIFLGISQSVMAMPHPLTVAAVLSTTGIAAPPPPHNLPLVPLIELAVDEINSQGGVLGHQLKLLLIDNHSTPIGSTQAARKAIKNHAIAVPWYDAFMLLRDAVDRAKSLDTDKIRNALAATRGFQGASGTISFDMNGDPVVKEMVILRYEKGKPVYLKTMLP